MRPVVSSTAAQTWRTPWISSAGTTTKAAETSASPNGIPSACIWLTMKVAAAMRAAATKASRWSYVSPIVWLGKPGSTALSCASAKIASSVDTGIKYGHSADDTLAHEQSTLHRPPAWLNPIDVSGIRLPAPRADEATSGLRCQYHCEFYSSFFE